MIIYAKTAGKLADYLADTQCSLKILDLSSNKFGSDSYELLKAGFHKNTSLNKIDLRFNKFSTGTITLEIIVFKLNQCLEHEKDLCNIIIKHELTSNKIPFVPDFNYYEKLESNFLINSYLI